MTDPRKTYRSRRRNGQGAATVPFETVLDELRAGNVTAERWQELRAAAIRSLLHERPATNPKDAATICDVFFQQPFFIPGRRPRGCER